MYFQIASKNLPFDKFIRTYIISICGFLIVSGYLRFLF
jgi:hypothetical protein